MSKCFELEHLSTLKAKNPISWFYTEKRYEGEKNNRQISKHNIQHHPLFPAAQLSGGFRHLMVI